MNPRRAPRGVARRSRASSSRWTRDSGRQLWRFRTGRDRIVTARGRQDRLRRLVEPQGLRAQPEERQGPLVVRHRRGDRQLRRVRGRRRVHRRRTTVTSTRSNAWTGELRWRASSFSRFGRREYFYATPTVAYGRVYIGNTDGTLYAFGAKSGNLLWARNAGTYVYSAAAVWRQRVYIGTYDGYFRAFDAATGDPVWSWTAPGEDPRRADRDGGPRLLRHRVDRAERAPVAVRQARRPRRVCARRADRESSSGSTAGSASTRRSSPTSSAST